MITITLVLGLFSEGSTDNRFLPGIIQRTAERIISERGRGAINVNPVIVLDKPEARTRIEQITEVSRQAVGYHALIVHSDADHDKPDRAMNERFLPGKNQVDSLRLKQPDQYCDHLIPIIPVYMVEAWMLADSRAIGEALHLNLSAKKLGLPEKAKLVESIANPKQTLIQAVQQARAELSRRRRSFDIGYLYQPLAELVRLEVLDEVPAYQRFVADLSDMLKARNLID